MNRFNLNAYKLQKYVKCKGNKSAILNLTEHLPAITHSRNIGSIELDDDDINQLLKKYKISELEEKEIEQEITFKKLNDLQNEIKFLKTL